jgi:hypothetical protein
MRRSITSLLAAAMLSTLVAGAVTARDAKVTYGDARAQFLNVDGGGGVIRAKKGFGDEILYIPPANGLNHSVRPLPFFDGLRYCTNDWHLVTILNHYGDGDFGFTSEEAKKELEGTTVTFTIPGVDTSDVQTTSVRRVPDPANVISNATGEIATPPVWSRAWGAFYAPGALLIGTHTPVALLDFPGGFQFPLGPITFHIDPAGSGACL